MTIIIILILILILISVSRIDLLLGDQGNSKNLFLAQFQDEQTFNAVFNNMFASSMPYFFRFSIPCNPLENVLVTAVSLFTSLIEGNIEGIFVVVFSLVTINTHL
jgi:hypothetical protein